MKTAAGTSENARKRAAVAPKARRTEEKEREELAQRAATEGPTYDAASLQKLREALWTVLEGSKLPDATEVAAYMKLILDGRRQALAEAKAAQDARGLDRDQESAAITTVENQLLELPSSVPENERSKLEGGG